MFGDLTGMMGKLKEAQKKVEATKERLNTVFLDESDQNDQIKVVISANREIKTIEIDTSLLNDKDQLEDYLVVTLNKAIKRAGEIHDSEIAAVAKEGMPNIPGLNLFG